MIKKYRTIVMQYEVTALERHISRWLNDQQGGDPGGGGEQEARGGQRHGRPSRQVA